ncbi:MAG TPA: hypothetical protein VFB60_10015 [Ktedonobacteraceae bacterium]|nr:hypothetical protein [Ktedonobacteraceae bacterium]
MNCSSCGTTIAPGVTYCPSCGMPTPYYTSSSGSTPYSPTVAASPYGGGSGQPMPPTEYGPPMGYPGSQPQDPYQPYNAPAPQNPYSAPANAQVPPAYNYGNQPAYPAQGYAPGMQPGMYGAAPIPRRRSNVGVILAVIGAIVVLACVGSIVAVSALSRNSNPTTNTSSTTTTQNTTNGVSPSGQPISPAAAAVISNVRTTSSVDSNFVPTHLTNAFTPGQKVYAVFDINSNGSPGCSIAKWYENNQLADTENLQHNPENQVAYFYRIYNTATQGAVELYWTTNTDCLNGQLAQVVRFTVGTQTSTGVIAPLAAMPSAAIVPEWQ